MAGTTSAGEVVDKSEAVAGMIQLRNYDEIGDVLVSMARLCYGAGMELDPDRPPVRDPGTHYEIYSSVPVCFRNL